MFSAHAGIELYAEAFGAAGALERLDAFAGIFGAGFYGLPKNSDSLTLVKETHDVPATLPFGAERLVPFRAAGTVAWRVV